MNREDEGEMTAAGPLDDDDLLSEILLRLPPQPSSLPRASLVCKRWRSLVSDSGFSRRFRIHHRRNPPLLGFFHMDSYELSFLPTLEAPNRVSPTRFFFQRDDGDLIRCLGCRHGLFLIFLPRSMQVVVSDPVTGDEHRLRIPPAIAIRAQTTVINGAVFRAAGDVHFQVVLVMADDYENHRRAFACVYSSATGRWGDLISTLIPSGVYLNLTPTLVCQEAAVLVGESLYWLLVGHFIGILEFNLDKQRLAVIQVPVDFPEEEEDDFTVTRTEAGELGFLYFSEFSAQLWSMKTNCNGVASWVLVRSIELDKLLPLNAEEETAVPRTIGFAECNNVVFIRTRSGIFMIQLESLQFEKLRETDITSCHPFEIVYAAGI